MWKFSCYLKSRGDNVIQQWYDETDLEIQADFDATINHLSKRENKDWDRPYIAQLKNKLFELRMSGKSGQHRVIGFYGIAVKEFTMLLPFKKGRESDTQRAIEEALKRKHQIETGVNKTEVWEYE